MHEYEFPFLSFLHFSAWKLVAQFSPELFSGFDQALHVRVTRKCLNPAIGFQLLTKCAEKFNFMFEINLLNFGAQFNCKP